MNITHVISKGHHKDHSEKMTMISLIGGIMTSTSTHHAVIMNAALSTVELISVQKCRGV